MSRNAVSVLKNVTNVPTRTFCFVAATQIPQGNNCLSLTHILAICDRVDPIRMNGRNPFIDTYAFLL